MWHFEIAHLPGKTNYAADATSRSPSSSTERESPIAHLAGIRGVTNAEDPDEDEEEILTVSIAAAIGSSMAITWDDLTAAAATDRDYQNLIEAAASEFADEH